jgi:tripartite-type tricarboxylate transporter receptor subunit TctC
MKTLNLSIIKETLILLGLLMMSTFSAHAAYPEKPITLVVPYVAGASTDSLARLVG